MPKPSRVPPVLFAIAFVVWPAFLFLLIMSIGRYDKHLAIGVDFAIGIVTICAFVVWLVRAARVKAPVTSGR